MDKSYYVEYYTLERKHWWFIVRGKIIMDRIRKSVPTDQPLKILNVGVATGRSTELLSQLGEVTSLEYDKDCCEFTSERMGIEIINGSVLELPFEDNSFDLVCAFDVIEHIEDDQLGVSEMKRVCKSGGHVCVTVPAFMSLWSHHDVVNHHFRRYVMQPMKDLFDGNGQTIYRTYFNSLLFPPIWFFRKLSRLSSQENREGAGSDFSVSNVNSLGNKIAGVIFEIERAFLNMGIKFPAGVSILYLWKK